MSEGPRSHPAVRAHSKWRTVLALCDRFLEHSQLWLAIITMKRRVMMEGITHARIRLLPNKVWQQIFIFLVVRGSWWEQRRGRRWVAE